MARTDPAASPSLQSDIAKSRWIKMSPAERSEATAPAREARFQHFLAQVPEDLDPDERVRRAHELRRIAMRKLTRRRLALLRQAGQLAADAAALDPDGAA